MTSTTTDWVTLCEEAKLYQYTSPSSEDPQPQKQQQEEQDEQKPQPETLDCPQDSELKTTPVQTPAITSSLQEKSTVNPLHPETPAGQIQDATLLEQSCTETPTGQIPGLEVYRRHIERQEQEIASLKQSLKEAHQLLENHSAWIVNNSHNISSNKIETDEKMDILKQEFLRLNQTCQIRNRHSQEGVRRLEEQVNNMHGNREFMDNVNLSHQDQLNQQAQRTLQQMDNMEHQTLIGRASLGLYARLEQPTAYQSHHHQVHHHLHPSTVVSAQYQRPTQWCSNDFQITDQNKHTDEISAPALPSIIYHSVQPVLQTTIPSSTTDTLTVVTCPLNSRPTSLPKYTAPASLNYSIYSSQRNTQRWCQSLRDALHSHNQPSLETPMGQIPGTTMTRASPHTIGQGGEHRIQQLPQLQEQRVGHIYNQPQNQGLNVHKYKH